MAKNKKKLIQTELLFRDDRDMLPQEYASLSEKKNKGYMNADMFRKNLFNASSRGTRTLYKKPKQIWTGKDGGLVSVSHSLHQKHADVLSLIYSEGFRNTKSDKDGSYEIHISLYAVAKAMGYKQPKSGADKVKKYINELRWTDLIIEKDGSVLRTTILDDALYSHEKDTFVIKIKGRNAKILAYSTGIKFEKTLNRKIVSIPDRLSKLKAMIRFVIASKPTKHGYTLEYFFEKFGVGLSGSEETRKNQKSLFKKQLSENKKWLDSFNLRWEKEEEKIYYDKQVGEISFILPLNKERIVLEIQKKENPYVEYIGKFIKIEDEIFEVLDVVESQVENHIDIKLRNTHTRYEGWSKNSTKEALKGRIDDFEKK